MTKKIISIIVLVVIVAAGATSLYILKQPKPFVEELIVGYDDRTPKLEHFVLGNEIDLNQVKAVSDLTDITKSLGTKEVILSYKDKEYKVKLTVEDRDAPEFIGLQDLEAYIGDTIKYKSNITVKDNVDTNPTVDVDTSKVNPTTAGTYDVTYTVKDASGNKNSQTVTITIKEKPEGYVSQEELDALCDDIIKEIITDDMDDMAKLEAIYTYIRGHVSYSDGHDKPGYVQAAYLGFTTHRGECYTYWACSKALLDKVGIKNYDIHNVPEVPGHYWNLVDIGEGWYHFDTCPRKGGFDGLYKDNATIKAYSDSHKKSHEYDPSLYPTIQ